jgi:signal transduction histidine kinase
MGPDVCSFAVRYGTAVLAFLVALLVRWLLDPLLGNLLPFLFACLAVVVVAWHGGFGPSFVALVLGFLTAAYCFLSPRYCLAESLAGHPLQSSGFLFLGLTIGLFSEALRVARLKALALADEAVRQRCELEQEVAQRQRLEEELHQRAEELAQADRRKDEFLAMLGHELRNPLAPIRNAIQVMQMLGPPDPQLRWARDVIDRQVRQMARLVDDLLDVSRISRGKITLNREVVELAGIIERAVESSRSLLEVRRHQFAELMPPEKIWLEADPARLAQVVANLLNNAAKYTEAGGQIRLAVAREGGAAVVRVQDNGMGIPADFLPHVFDLFTQGDRSLARSEGGLGIGLTLVKSLVEMHGGSVEAHSQGPNQGSEFVVRLPILAAPPARVAQEQHNGTDHPVSRPRRVLVVDDNTDSAESLDRLLGLQGHEVRTAHDGPTALRVAQMFGPEVVLLDIGLPQMDGYEVARQLREQIGLRQVVLVALTGYGQEEDRRKAAEAGFDAHLTKPADPAALHRLLTGARS